MNKTTRVQIFHLHAAQVCLWVEGESYHSLHRGPQSVVPAPAAAASPAHILEMQILGPTPELLTRGCI